MTRQRIATVVLGLVVWFVLVTIAGRLMQAAWPAYAARVGAFDFTLAMLIARLAIGAAVTITAGRVAAWWSGNDHASLWGLGIALVLIFVPVHVQLWAKFPAVYHAAFLLSLVPLTLAGGGVLTFLSRGGGSGGSHSERPVAGHWTRSIPASADRTWLDNVTHGVRRRAGPADRP